jgi:hypothetical protein
MVANGYVVTGLHGLKKINKREISRVGIYCPV